MNVILKKRLFTGILRVLKVVSYSVTILDNYIFYDVVNVPQTYSSLCVSIFQANCPKNFTIMQKGRYSFF